MPQWSAYRSIVFEVSLNQSIYVLTLGDWYRVESSFADSVKNSVRALPESSHTLPVHSRGTTEDVYNRVRSRDALRACPDWLWPVARRKLDQVNAAVSLLSLRIPPGNRLEALKGDRPGQHSIRINDQYRVCFVWTDDGPERVEITDYH